MTSNAAADEIQQIIKSDRAMKTTRFQLKLLIAMLNKEKMKNIHIMKMSTQELLSS
jgi:hypothetical protein